MFSDEPGDKCFNKFAAGDEKKHTKKDGSLGFDRKRLERLNWIFEVIEKYDKCKECNYFVENKDKKYSNRILLNCIFNSYKIVICIRENKNENIVITAYYLSSR